MFFYSVLLHGLVFAVLYKLVLTESCRRATIQFEHFTAVFVSPFLWSSIQAWHGRPVAWEICWAYGECSQWARTRRIRVNIFEVGTTKLEMTKSYQGLLFGGDLSSKSRYFNCDIYGGGYKLCIYTNSCEIKTCSTGFRIHSESHLWTLHCSFFPTCLLSPSTVLLLTLLPFHLPFTPHLPAPFLTVFFSIRLHSSKPFVPSPYIYFSLLPIFLPY